MISIKAEIKMGTDRTAYVTAKIRGLTDERLAEMSRDIVAQARTNAGGLSFQSSTGALASGIQESRIGDRQYRIETTSGHASYIEFGTRFIEGKMPFLWPAYRLIKKRFFSGRTWV